MALKWPSVCCCAVKKLLTHVNIIQCRWTASVCLRSAVR